MPSTRRHLYDLNFKLKIVAEAEAVNNNRALLFSGELRMTAKRASMGRYRPKDPELDQQLADWFDDQWTQGKHCFVI